MRDRLGELRVRQCDEPLEVRDDIGHKEDGPVPPGVFGSRELTPEGINPVTHRAVNGQPVRRPIEDAKRLLANNDGFGFFGALGELVVTGPTRTNVNDYRVILVQ